jgi:excisionase family DNA binding protein
MPPAPAVPWPGAPGPPPGTEYLLAPGQVAVMFGVNPATVARWEGLGKLTAVRTAGGHRRYREDEIKALLEEGGA